MKKKKEKKPQKVTGKMLAGMFLIMSPFLLGGAWAGVRLAQTLAEYYSMQSWVEAPVTIGKVDIRTKRHNRRKRSDATFRIVDVSYTYDFAGQGYRGERLSLHGRSDADRDLQTSRYEELKRHREGRQPFPGYVNPNDPTEAVLYRSLVMRIVGLYALNMCAFGGVGVLICGFGIQKYLQQRHD